MLANQSNPAKSFPGFREVKQVLKRTYRHVPLAKTENLQGKASVFSHAALVSDRRLCVCAPAEVVHQN